MCQEAGQGSHLAELAATQLLPDWLLEVAVASASDDMRRNLGPKVGMAEALSVLRRAGLQEDLVSFGDADPTLPEEELVRLARGPLCAQKLVAMNPYRTQSLEERLRRNPNTSLRCAVAIGPALSDAGALALARDRRSRVRLALLQRISLTDACFSTLAADPIPHIRRLVGLRHDVPQETLRVLAQDPNPSVRRTVLSHRDIPADLFVQMASDSRADLRALMARRPDLPREAQEILARDGERYVVHLIDSNPNIDPDVAILASDHLAGLPHPIHRRDDQAKKRIFTPMGPPELHEMWRSVSSCKRPDHLARYARASDPAIQYAVAANRHTPVEVLRSIPCEQHVPMGTANSPHFSSAQYDMREALIKNPASPPDILERIIHQGLRAQFLSVLAHPNCPEKLRTHETVRAIIAHVSESSHPSYPSLDSIAAAAHPLMPAGLPARLATSPSWLARYAIASSDHAPPAILKALSDDANRLVRAAAQAKLTTAPSQWAETGRAGERSGAVS
jgi:hypothetical protein